MTITLNRACLQCLRRAGKQWCRFAPWNTSTIDGTNKRLMPCTLDQAHLIHGTCTTEPVTALWLISKAICVPKMAITPHRACLQCLRLDRKQCCCFAPWNISPIDGNSKRLLHWTLDQADVIHGACRMGVWVKKKKHRIIPGYTATNCILTYPGTQPLLLGPRDANHLTFSSWEHQNWYHPSPFKKQNSGYEIIYIVEL